MVADVGRVTDDDVEEAAKVLGSYPEKVVQFDLRVAGLFEEGRLGFLAGIAVDLDSEDLARAITTTERTKTIGGRGKKNRLASGGIEDSILGPANCPICDCLC